MASDEIQAAEYVPHGPITTHDSQREVAMRKAIVDILELVIPQLTLDHWEECDAYNCEHDECQCPESDDGDRMHECICHCSKGAFDNIRHVATKALAP